MCVFVDVDWEQSYSRRAGWKMEEWGGGGEFSLCYLLGFACLPHYESCFAHFLAGVLEHIIHGLSSGTERGRGWRKRDKDRGGDRERGRGRGR